MTGIRSQRSMKRAPRQPPVSNGLRLFSREAFTLINAEWRLDKNHGLAPYASPLDGGVRLLFGRSYQLAAGFELVGTFKTRMSSSPAPLGRPNPVTSKLPN